MALATPVTYSPNAALLIDFDNVTMGIRSDLQSELRNLLASDIIKGKVQLRRAYADWRRYPQYVAPLAESSIDMIMAPAYGSSKKNATDIRLAIDALELVFTRPEIGTYILLSGDSDFSTLVIKLKEYGKYVIGVGIRESSSDLLVMNCDEYYSYNALAGLVRTESEDTAGRRDPWELVSEAIQRMQRNGDVMRADRLKQVMQDIDSTFDEKNLGMSKFSRFVTEAAGRGLLSVTKLDTGQLEVAPPKPKTAEAPVALPPAVESVATPAAESRSTAEGRSAEDRGAEDRGARRGRRGGRGRDRADRPDRAAERPVPVAVVPQPAVAAVADGIGTSGERLTRDEAFRLVREAVGALATDERPARASAVRAKSREILGRDSASLSQDNFARILRDAHDADVIDLRRRGDDFEVAPAVTAAPVSEQLNLAAAATRHDETTQAAAGASSSTAKPTHAPRGMAPRGVGGRSRQGIGGKVAGPPPELLSIGVVDVNPPAVVHAPHVPEVPVVAAVAVAEPPIAPEKPRRSSTARKRAPAKAAESDAPKARATTARKRPRKTASKVAPGSSDT
ncbi:MAG TPA: NYN domain-containing protein [Gemmatimonadaceae bacterium]|nr:NYN domain-containing protein [Gemmatimonadaceae bacterium]